MYTIYHLQTVFSSFVRTIIGVCSDSNCFHLKKTSWSQKLEALSKKLIMIPNASFQFTAVDEVKLLRKMPFLFEVVNLEPHVRGHPTTR